MAEVIKLISQQLFDRNGRLCQCVVRRRATIGNVASNQSETGLKPRPA